MFNQEIKLPENLTHLTFGYSFNQEVELPFSIKYLCLNSYDKIIDYLHDGIEELVLENGIDLELNNLPNSIKKIVFKNDYHYFKLNNLPNNIELIELPKKYELKIDKIPKTLKKIKCSKDYEFKNDFVDIEIEYYEKY